MGWRYFCDEFALVSPTSLHIQPFPKAICIKAGSFDIVRRLGLSLGKRLYRVKGLGCRVGYIETSAATTGAVMASQPVRFVIFPRFVAGASTRLFPISRGQAVFALRHHVLNATAVGRRTVPILIDVARGAQCFGLEFGKLDAACDMLESLAAGACNSRRAAV